MRKIRIGSGAGFAGDRIDPAIDLIEQGNLDYIGFECLAERTIAIAARQRADNPNLGYNELLEERFRQILPALVGKRVRLITNMGAANPIAAAGKVAELARHAGLSGLRIAAVTGDDVLGRLDEFRNLQIMESGKQLQELGGQILSANAYLGVDGILQALKNDADIIITGRVSDPALFLAPAIHEFGWSVEDWPLLGQGTMMGHLLECAAQVSGGYFADPGYKDVPDLWRVGFPFVDLAEDGTFEISKLSSSGGLISQATVREQLLYEVLDPSCYLTPDVAADFSGVVLETVDKDRIRVTGGSGHPKNGLLKISIGVDEGWTGEGEISYGGPGALSRAKLAGEIIERRIRHLKLPVESLRIDYLGVNALYGNDLSRRLEGYNEICHEVRLRVAVRTKSRHTAGQIGREVEALYLNGPAGGGGVRKYCWPVVGIVSVLAPEYGIKSRVEILEV